MTSDEIKIITGTLKAALSYLDAKRITVGPKVPRAHAILETALEATGYGDAWEAGTLTADEHIELLHLIRLEGRRWLREQASAVLDEIDELESKALFGDAAAKAKGFFRGASKYIRELFVAGVLAVAGPSPLTAAEMQALDAEVATQDAYLKTFEREFVEGNKPLDGTFVSRAEQYGASVWGATQEILRAGAIAATSYTREKRLHRGSDQPCRVCAEEESKGWRPIGTLRKIGDSPCICNCHCVFIFGDESSAKSFAFDLKRYVPCRDERGRFASCNGAPQGTRHPAQDGKPKPGSGGGKKPRKPRKPKESGDAKPAKPKKEPKPKKPAAEKPPKEAKPKEPKNPADKKPPKEPKTPKKPEPALPKPAEKPKEPEAPKQSIREAMTSRESGRSKDEVIHEYLVKHQTAPAPVQKHGMAEQESMSSIEIDGFRLHYPPPPATFDPSAPVHPTISTIRDYLSFGKDPLPHELARHTSNVYMSSQANKDDRVWQLRYNDPNFASSATGGDGDVVTYNTNRFTKHIVAHEMGHNLAKARYGRVDPTYGGDYANAIRSGEKAPSDYAKMNDAEDFAEAVKGYARDPKHFAGIWPKRAAVLKRMLEDPDYAG